MSRSLNATVPAELDRSFRYERHVRDPEKYAYVAAQYRRSGKTLIQDVLVITRRNTSSEPSPATSAVEEAMDALLEKHHGPRPAGPTKSRTTYLTAFSALKSLQDEVSRQAR